MDKNTKILIGGSTFLLLGTAGYFIWKNKKQKSLINPELPDNTSSVRTLATSFVSCPSYKANSFPISRGMKGNEVKRIQEMLNKKFYSGLKIDGCFGPKTEAALFIAIGKRTLSAQDFAKYE